MAAEKEVEEEEDDRKRVVKDSHFSLPREWKKGRTIIRHDRNDRTITPITIGLIELSFLSIDLSHF